MKKYAIILTLITTVLLFLTACGRDDYNDNDAYINSNMLYEIPFFGNRDDLRLSQSHTLAFAEATENAGIGIEWWWAEHGINFDALYPVLIDVSGDGTPLLLLVGQTENYLLSSSLPFHPALLFGYANGEIQQFETNMEIGIMEIDDERLLSVGQISDFGGSYNLYRISNGAAEFVSEFVIIADWHGSFADGEISINGEELSAEEFFTAMANIPTISLIEMGHPGNIVISSSFEGYFPQSFSREEVVRMFLDFAGY